ncbi:MAG: hypothetical protein PHX87_04270 [Candidatus Peribacteraceae bacterium]|nr:hypothetical protein [Candidatus Peribacteraceae bacterium]
MKDPRWLWNGRDFENFKLRAREIWSLWLLCVVYNWFGSTDLTFGEADDCDGVIVDKKTGDCVLVENVAAMDFPGNSLPRGEERIIQAVMHKALLGEKYASGKILIVFTDGAGKYEPNKIAKAVDGKHHFERIYLIGLITDKDGTEYSYSVLMLNNTNAELAVVRINQDFTDWKLIDVSNAFAAQFL